MKKCPVCNRTYTDETIDFCLEDGVALNEIFTASSVTKPYSPELSFIKREIPAADASTVTDERNPPRPRVSILVRLLAAACYSIPAIGGALSSMLLINVFQALRKAEGAGIGAVMAGMNEASVPLRIALYLAALGGIVVIIVLVVRALVETKTAAPPAWFFAAGILGLLPAALFWKAQLLVIEVLSPGSVRSAGDVAGTGAEVSQWLVISVVAAPVVMILLAAAAVIPFSSRKKSKPGSILTAAAVAILLVAVAVGIPFLIGEPKRVNEAVALPTNVKNVEYDFDIDKASAMVLTLTSDNKLYLRSKDGRPEKAAGTGTTVAREELPEKLKRFAAAASPDKQIVYLKADPNAAYENVRQIFDIVRKAGIDKVGLVVVGEKNDSDPYQTYPAKLEVKLPAPADKTNAPVRPNPLILVAELQPGGALTLNREAKGTISNPQPLVGVLREIFKDREARGVLREGTNEVEKTVFVKVSGAGKYGDFINLVEAVRAAGTEPVGVQLDDDYSLGAG